MELSDDGLVASVCAAEVVGEAACGLERGRSRSARDVGGK
jgi:hypothetical protein